jgi:hypothetical protein
MRHSGKRETNRGPEQADGFLNADARRRDASRHRLCADRRSRGNQVALACRPERLRYDGHAHHSGKRTPNGKGNLVLKQRFMRVLMLATIVLASVAVSGPATPAYAGGYGCTGSSVGSWPIYPYWSNSSSEIEGDIHLYYDSSTGWNCAVVVKRSTFVFYGMATNMYIYMNNSSYDDYHIKNNFDSDSGAYKYYAGPVRVYGKNMCIWIVAGIAENSGPVSDSFNFDVRYVNRVACG